MALFAKLIAPSENRLSGYLIACGLISVALLLRLLIWPIDAGLQYVTFFPAVALTAVCAGFWPGMFTTIIGVLLATFIFTQPYMSFSIEVLRNSLWSNLVFTLDGLVVCLSIEAMHRFRRKYALELEESKSAHAMSEQSRQQLEAIVNNVLDGIITINQVGQIRSFNQAASQIFGFHENEVIGKNIAMLMPEPYRSRHDQFLQHYQNTGEKKIIGNGREVEGKRKNGEVFPLELAVCEITGIEQLFCGVVRDISERKAHENHMFHLAHHDPLTGLPNRTLLLDRLEQLLAIARRDSNKLAVLFIDLDEFKEINDTLGHDIGDLLLKAVTTRLLDCLRESDTAARMGGDEFVVLLPNVETEQGALLVSEKIRNALFRPFMISGKSLTISCSIGVVLYPEHGINQQELIKHADTAMYSAKNLGKNHSSIYSPSMIDNHQEVLH